VRRQQVAVLFVDIVGFTRMAEAMTPEAVVGMLREFHGRMATQIFDCGGTIEKYIGDEIFAVFGLPSASPHDALNALRCAALMLKELEAWNRERAERGELPLSIGIGVNYGPAVMGDVGTEHSLAFTVIGDTVNVASRLQNLTATSKTTAGGRRRGAEADRRRPGRRPAGRRLQDRGERELRGRTAAIRIWTAEGILTRLVRYRR
jgi:adenylate cyclase